MNRIDFLRFEYFLFEDSVDPQSIRTGGVQICKSVMSFPILSNVKVIEVCWINAVAWSDPKPKPVSGWRSTLSLRSRCDVD